MKRVCRLQELSSVIGSKIIAGPLLQKHPLLKEEGINLPCIFCIMSSLCSKRQVALNCQPTNTYRYGSARFWAESAFTATQFVIHWGPPPPLCKHPLQRPLVGKATISVQIPEEFNINHYLPNPFCPGFFAKLNVNW